MVKRALELHNGLHSVVVQKPNEYLLVEFVDEEGVEEVALGEASKLAQSCVALLTETDTLMR